jgi:hypothetical protein
MPNLGGALTPQAPQGLGQGQNQDPGLAALLSYLESMYKSGVGGQYGKDLSMFGIGPTYKPTEDLFGNVLNMGNKMSAPVIVPVSSPTSPATPTTQPGLPGNMGGTFDNIAEGLFSGLGAVSPEANVGMPTGKQGPISMEAIAASMFPGVVSSFAKGEFSPSIIGGPVSLGAGYAGKELGNKFSEWTGLENAPAPGPGLFGDLFGDKLGGYAKTAAQMGVGYAGMPFGTPALEAVDLGYDALGGKNISNRVARTLTSMLFGGLLPMGEQLPVVGPAIKTFANNAVISPLSGLINRIAQSLGLARYNQGFEKSIPAGYYGEEPTPNPGFISFSPEPVPGMSMLNAPPDMTIGQPAYGQSLGDALSDAFGGDFGPGGASGFGGLGGTFGGGMEGLGGDFGGFGGLGGDYGGNDGLGGGDFGGGADNAGDEGGVW